MNKLNYMFYSLGIDPKWFLLLYNKVGIQILPYRIDILSAESFVHTDKDCREFKVTKIEL